MSNGNCLGDNCPKGAIVQGEVDPETVVLTGQLSGGCCSGAIPRGVGIFRRLCVVPVYMNAQILSGDKFWILSNRKSSQTKITIVVNMEESFSIR